LTNSGDSNDDACHPFFKQIDDDFGLAKQNDGLGDINDEEEKDDDEEHIIDRPRFPASVCSLQFSPGDKYYLAIVFLCNERKNYLWDVAGMNQNYAGCTSASYSFVGTALVSIATDGRVFF